MFVRWSAIATVLAIVTAASTARAEYPVLASTIESGFVIPTSSTKELLLSLQVLVPVARTAGTRLLAGLGPVGMTRHLLGSNIPELVAFGVMSSIRLEF